MQSSAHEVPSSAQKERLRCRPRGRLWDPLGPWDPRAWGPLGSSGTLWVHSKGAIGMAPFQCGQELAEAPIHWRLSKTPRLHGPKSCPEGNI